MRYSRIDDEFTFDGEGGVSELHDRMAERLFQRMRETNLQVEKRSFWFMKDEDRLLMTIATNTYIQFVRRTGSRWWEKK